MTDDIVTTLRELAAKQDAEWSDPTDAPLTMYQVAADEIERLRNILIGIALNKQVWKGFDFE